MIKRFAAFCIAPVCAVAQLVCALGPGTAAYRPAEDQRPSTDTMLIAARLNAAMKEICADHCPQVALYRNATAANAMLVLDAGQAKLVYAPQFFTTVYAANGDPGLVAVFAHEMGHALDDTMGAAWVNAKWHAEVRADAWAGCILGRLKKGRGEAAATLAALGKYPAPPHPAWPQRLVAIRAGFTHCGGSAAELKPGAK